MTSQDHKRTVSQGYDKMGEAYGRLATRYRTAQRARYESILLERLDEGASVLDLGCGSGIPTTRRLARKFQVTGVDISKKQVERARDNVPNSEFICSDMAALDFPPETFDGVSAFYSIIHLPRDEHGAMLKSIASWLRPGGLLVASLGTGDTEVDFDQSWMGTPMFWSTYDAETNRRLVEESGLQTISALAETTTSHGDSETFLWVVARKPEKL